MTFGFARLVPYLPQLFAALWVSCYMTVIAFSAGTLISVLIYAGRSSSLRPLRVVCVAYVEIMRNTPVLVQLYLAYFALPDLGLNLSAVWAGVIALLLNNSGYCAEIFRAGFEAVPKGLIEASTALGLSKFQAFRDIRLAIATRNVFPALVNQFILLFLFSSVAAIIGAPELMDTILNIGSKTELTFGVLIIGAIMYFVVASIASIALRQVERRSFRWAS